MKWQGKESVEDLEKLRIEKEKEKEKSNNLCKSAMKKDKKGFLLSLFFFEMRGALSFEFKVCK